MAERLRVNGTVAQLRRLRLTPGVTVVYPSERLSEDGTGSVDVVADPAVVAAEGLQFVAIAKLSPKPDGYLDSRGFQDEMARLAHRHVDCCEHRVLPHLTHEGRPVSYLRLQRPATTPKATVILLGGVHAREWAPPEALLSLARGLLVEGIDHPGFELAGAEYAQWLVPQARLRRITDNAAIVIVPLVNPDGHDYTLATPEGASDDEIEDRRSWRKNRRLPDDDQPAACCGVDVNRNFDIAWDYEEYYTEAAAKHVVCSKDPCDPQVYIGRAAASEPETRNVQWLVDNNPVTHFCDVHSYSRDILYPWGMETNQAKERTMNWHNSAWDLHGEHGGRDGSPGPKYGEYMPADLSLSHRRIAEHMAGQCAAQAGSHPTAVTRSRYTVKRELHLYPMTGVTTDYVISRWRLDPRSRPRPHAFCVECGQVGTGTGPDPQDDDGGFWPDHATVYPKIEREVHGALIALLEAAVGVWTPRAKP